MVSGLVCTIEDKNCSFALRDSHEQPPDYLVGSRVQRAMAANRESEPNLIVITKNIPAANLISSPAPTASSKLSSAQAGDRVYGTVPFRCILYLMVYVYPPNDRPTDRLGKH